jgi:hypothetical protein
LRKQAENTLSLYMNKICCKCKTEKLITEFNKDNSKKDKLNPRCKLCHSREKKKNKSNEINIRKRNMDYVYNFLLKNPCVDCSENNPVVLQFDHLYNKKQNIAKMLQGHCSIKSLENEMSKCAVRCANCHTRKTAKDFNWNKWQKISR